MKKALNEFLEVQTQPIASIMDDEESKKARKESIKGSNRRAAGFGHLTAADISTNQEVPETASSQEEEVT